MTEFKAGDRVKVVDGSANGGEFQDKIGVVESIYNASIIRIVFDESINGYPDDHVWSIYSSGVVLDTSIDFDQEGPVPIPRETLYEWRALLEELGGVDALREIDKFMFPVVKQKYSVEVQGSEPARRLKDFLNKEFPGNYTLEELTKAKKVEDD